jgi:hypothetical protein
MCSTSAPGSERWICYELLVDGMMVVTVMMVTVVVGTNTYLALKILTSL